MTLKHHAVVILYLVLNSMIFFVIFWKKELQLNKNKLISFFIFFSIPEKDMNMLQNHNKK